MKKSIVIYSKILLVFTIFFTILFSLIQVQAASFQGLGDLPGGDFFSVARNISSDGSTVVGTSISSCCTEAFRWTQEGEMIGLGDLPGGDFKSYAAPAFNPY